MSVNPVGGVNFNYAPSPINPPANGVLNYYDGTQVTLTAPPNANGNSFVRWEKDGVTLTSAQAATLLMDSDHVMSMVFAAPAGGAGFTVTTNASPANAGTATGGGAYASGATVTLSAQPANGYHFINWTMNTSWQNGGQVFTADSSHQFQATTNLALVANFGVNNAPYTVTTSSSPNTSGTTSGAGPYQNGGAPFGYSGQWLGIRHLDRKWNYCFLLKQLRLHDFPVS